MKLPTASLQYDSALCSFAFLAPNIYFSTLFRNTVYTLKICGFHDGERSNCGLLGYDTV